MKHIIPGILLLGTLALSACADTSGFELTVLASTVDGQLTTDSKLKIEYGTNAEIPLALEPGKSVIQVLSDGERLDKYNYGDGVLTVGPITSPQTIKIIAGDPDDKIVCLAEPTSKLGGKVLSDAADWQVPKGTLITFTAIEKDGGKFLGWTAEKTLSRGGEIISTDYELTVSAGDAKFYYANFDDSGVPRPITEKLPSAAKPYSKQKVDIIYDPNGGKLSDGNATFTYSYGIDRYTMGNTLPDNGIFTRDGYVLVGYSTEKLGGKLIGVGHKFELPEGAKEVKLYCRWEKAIDKSRLKYTQLSDDTIRIDSFTSGSESKIYIPRSIDGKLVSTIGKNAFRSDTLTEIYIPSSVKKVEDYAFECPKLTKLILFDSITQMTDKSVSDVKIKTLDLQMASFPRYNNTYARKIERIICSDKPCVVFAAGSSKHYGLDSMLAEKLLDGKYTVVNCGTTAQANTVFYIESITPLLDDEDIIVYSPEQYAINTYWTSGNPELTEQTFRLYELTYECIRNVDLRNYTNLFAALTEYTTIRSRQKEQYFEIASTYIDVNGDCGNIPKNLNSPNFHHDKNGTFRFCDDFFDESFIPNMNRMIDALKSKGLTVYFSHPPYNKNACNPNNLNAESFDSYHKYISEVIHCELISDASEYILEGQYFSNTDYHVNAVGREMHTTQVVGDLIAAMNDNNVMGSLYADKEG